MASTQPDPYIGRVIDNGQYQILQKIGAGGMGTVYKASQPSMNRMVAVKILHPKLTTRKDLASRFRREARAMSHLTHPNTVRVFHLGELEDKALYIVMEYLEGKNLNQTLRREGPMAVERAVSILMQVCGALHEAHLQGIIHRDLKPENIFLASNGGLRDFPKLLDFGLAKVSDREMRPGSMVLTQVGSVFGTPEFMSPEQAQGKDLDARSDVYSLAVILYEALTGKLPFDAKTGMEHLQLHVSRAPIPIEARAPTRKFPPGLWGVLGRALEKRPDARFASSADFAEALRPFAAPVTLAMPEAAALEQQKREADALRHVPQPAAAAPAPGPAVVAHPVGVHPAYATNAAAVGPAAPQPARAGAVIKPAGPSPTLPMGAIAGAAPVPPTQGVETTVQGPPPAGVAMAAPTAGLAAPAPGANRATPGGSRSSRPAGGFHVSHAALLVIMVLCLVIGAFITYLLVVPKSKSSSTRPPPSALARYAVREPLSEAAKAAAAL
jgi:tRNA A-37 threonylcarbamoyl transferase component Bud32